LSTFCGQKVKGQRHSEISRQTHADQQFTAEDHPVLVKLFVINLFLFN